MKINGSSLLEFLQAHPDATLVVDNGSDRFVALDTTCFECQEDDEGSIVVMRTTDEIYYREDSD